MNIDYDKGRFFVSPIIGCKASCKYCYLHTRGIKQMSFNGFSIESIMDNILNHKQFLRGKSGSIISINAWGDMFSDEQYIDEVVRWIKKLLSLGNPVQIMSKFTIEEHLIEDICLSATYKDQILYSTTITSFSRWREIEKGTIAPVKRIECVRKFKKYGAQTNLMIKPFLENITDLDTDEFIDQILKNNVDFAVVGALYTNQPTSSSKKMILDCSSTMEMSYIEPDAMKLFIDTLKKAGIKVFKKSTCVNSNILGVKSSIYSSGLCMHCGNCNSQ